MVHAAEFATVIAACWLTARLLTNGRWSWQSPRAAILCWQAVGLALGLSAIGLPLAAALHSYRSGTAVALLAFAGDVLAGHQPTGVGLPQLVLLAAGLSIAAILLGTTADCLVRITRVRKRHRDLLTLVARDDPAVPGALVLDHPGAAAYCLPGVRPRVVVSAGALSLLDGVQLAAVLSHERAHARERHDLVLLPFTALCRALPGIGWVRAANATVALLVEMRADDRARSRHAAGALVGALQRFATVPVRVTPPGALAISRRPAAARQPATGPADDIQARVVRLLDPPSEAGRLRTAMALAVAGALVAAPVSLFLI